MAFKYSQVKPALISLSEALVLQLMALQPCWHAMVKTTVDFQNARQNHVKDYYAE